LAFFLYGGKKLRYLSAIEKEVLQARAALVLASEAVNGLVLTLPFRNFW